MKSASNMITVLLLLAIQIVTWGYCSENKIGLNSHTKISIAVMELEVSGVEPEIEEQISKILKEKFSKNAELIPDSIINHKIQEISSNIIGTSDTAENQIKAGRMASADKIITGLVTKIDDAIVISIKMTNVKTGTSENAIVNCYGSSEELLKKCISKIAKKLMSNIEK